jgi:predicted membrane protein
MNFQPTVIPNTDDHISSTSLFSSNKKTILSKDFKGGKINNIFGSIEIDFTNADLNGMAILDISQTFGELIITVPIDWRIETDISQLFAVVEDHRSNVYQTKKSDKILVLKGLSICAAVEIINNE